MHVGTHPTRNFATLEPSGIQLPLTGISKKSKNQKITVNYFFSSLNPFSYMASTGQATDPLRHNYVLQSPVFLINRRYPLFCANPSQYYG